ncbi:hypothetical protein IKE67_04145 [bacterium]|nr:hypothetical protein [bacterium]
MLKKAIIYSTILSLSITLSANAYVTNDELISPESLLNYNYSAISAEQVQLVKAQNANRPYRSPRYSKKKWWKKVWEYFDPATDDGYLMQHDIKPQQHWTDL